MSRPDTWSSPRPHTDASLRLHHYGPIEPMAAAKRGTIRLALLCAGLFVAGVVAVVAYG